MLYALYAHFSQSMFFMMEYLYEVEWTYYMQNTITFPRIKLLYTPTPMFSSSIQQHS